MTEKRSGLDPAKAFLLADLTALVPDSTVSRILHKNKAGNITIFAFGQGQGLSTHTAPFDAFVLVTEGVCEVTIDNAKQELKSGQCILMPAGIPHSLHAKEDFKMLLVMLKETDQAT
jgi:quercetin dioxygenase-like cupin family protein